MSGDPYSEKAIQGGDAAPLTGEQKRRAVMIARVAFDLMRKKGVLGADLKFDDWRHKECMQCVERGGLTFAAQSDWPFIMGHFHQLIANHTDDEQQRHVSNNVAFDMGKKALNQASSFALAKLRHECQAARAVMRDAESFCRGISFKRFHADPAGLNARQIWWLIFTLRRRCGQLKRKGGAA